MSLKISVFREDITPPIGHPLCAGLYPPAKGISDPLSANGIILFPDDQEPIVLCALDWAELSNGEYELWCQRLAFTAGTSRERVTIHCIHAHDSPWPDRDAQAILDQEGFPNLIMQLPWCREVMNNVAASVGSACDMRSEVTEIRAGKAPIEGIASNRRVMGCDGKVKGVRWTRCRDAALRAEPEGTIDPNLKTISFWQDERKLASLHYYAVHPTSYDGTGLVTPDFAGIARDRLAQEEGIPHIYFTECAGNITAGKFNDGIADNQELFTRRIYEGMLVSEASAIGCYSTNIEWRSVPIHLPPRNDQSADAMRKLLKSTDTSSSQRILAALKLAYRRRYEAGIPILVSALHLGDGAISLHTPGESFVEYQLYAQDFRSDRCVVVPSYGDCGPGYVTLARSFEEGGYEPTDSFCSIESEKILKEAIQKVITN